MFILPSLGLRPLKSWIWKAFKWNAAFAGDLLGSSINMCFLREYGHHWACVLAHDRLVQYLTDCAFIGQLVQLHLALLSLRSAGPVGPREVFFLALHRVSGGSYSFPMQAVASSLGSASPVVLTQAASHLVAASFAASPQALFALLWAVVSANHARGSCVQSQ